MKKKHMLMGVFATAMLVGFGAAKILVGFRAVNTFSKDATAVRAGDTALSDTGNAPLVDGRAERDNFYSQVGKLLQAEKFDQLDAMVDNLRNTRPHLLGGGSKLALFYSDLESWGKLEDRLQLFQKWADARPDSATARIALAWGYINYAWQARGSGWASEVKKEGWNLFAERLKKSRGILEETEKMTTKDPYLYYDFIWVAIGEGWDREKMEEVFKKGVAADPTYYPLYFSKANYLLPRWHGEPGDWVKFAEEAADMTKKTEGSSLYARIIQFIILKHRGTAEFKLDTGIFERSDIFWPKLKQGYEDKARLYPGSLEDAHAFCFFACLAQDRETAKRLFARIGNRPNEEIWGKRRSFERLRNLVNDETDDDPAFRKKISRFYQTANDVQDHMEQAYIFNNRGASAEAILQYSKALKLDPDLEGAYWARGNIYFFAKEYDKAIPDFTEAIRINPSNADIYINRGSSYGEKGEYDKAISDYTRAIALNPSLSQAYLYRGVVYFRKGNYDKTWEDVQKAQSLGYQVDPRFLETIRIHRGK